MGKIFCYSEKKKQLAPSKDPIKITLEEAKTLLKSQIMGLGIYFKPIDKIDYSKNTIGSVVDSFNSNFPDWQSSDIVLFSVHESRGSSLINNNEIDHLSVRKNLFNFKWESKLKIADLGILEAGAQIKDTYSALSDITYEIQKKENY